MIVDNTQTGHSASAFKAPMPGQGWTTDPNNPMPWETPPEITDVDEALTTIVHPLVTNDTLLGEFLKLAEGGLPLEHMVTLATYEGFKTGKWTPDVMLLLQEPLMYYMIAICESAEIDYNLDEDDMERTLQDPSYRYSSDPEGEVEVEAIMEEKIPEVVDEDLLAKVRGGSSLLSPKEPMIDEEELV